jgi:hypothetical protein
MSFNDLTKMATVTKIARDGYNFMLTCYRPIGLKQGRMTG